MILLRLVSWPYFRKHVLRSVLTTTGIALGVAVFVGMHTANQSVLSAFAQTIDRVAGKADLQITAGENGFGEEILEKVQSASTVGVAVPVIESIVESNIAGQGNLLILGIDMTGDRTLREYELETADDALDDPLVFLAQPDSLILSKEFADRNGIAIGSHLTLGTAEGDRAFTVRAIVKSSGLSGAYGGNIAIMDIYAAQKMFGRGRTFDRIDLAVKEGTSPADGVQELVALLGPAFEVQAPASRGRQAEMMLAGYTMMVNLSSAFALFIGMFIVFNAFNIAVTERRNEIGIVRSLGATRGQIVGLFLGESAFMGLVGSMLGVAAGLLAARAIGAAIGGLAGGLYGVAQQATELAADPKVMGVAAAIGVGTSLVGAIVPARNAATVEPVEALKKSEFHAMSAGDSRRRLVLAAAASLLAIACLFVADRRVIFYAGYALTIVVALLLTPSLTLSLTRGIRPALKWLRPVEGALAADSLIQAPRRTSATVAALMLSLALVVAFSGMARASYGSILDWIDTTLNPDLFVMPSQRLDLRQRRFPASMAEELKGIPGVGRVQMFRNGRIALQGQPAMLAAIEMRSFAETVRTSPVAGSADTMYQKAAAGEGAIVSDNLAQLRQLSLGQVLEIPAPLGTIRLPIVGILSDYTDQQGTVFIDRSLFVRYWNDDSVSDFRLYLTPGSDVGAVRRRIVESYAGRRQLFVLTNQESRRYILGIAGQWFSLMNVQIAIAVLVAILGIVNTLTVSIADRRRELGVLQAVGALRGQIRRTIWIEALAVAFLGLALGYALGALNLFYMLQIVQKDIAGLRLSYQFPGMTALAIVPIILGAALVAALWPAEAAVRGSLVEALEYE